MASIKVYLVDDEQRASDTLINLFLSFFSQVEIVGSTANIATAYTEIQELTPDLVFLDIEMGNESGFDLLELFDEVNFKVVFVTAHEEYALRAIKFSALDYIVKPPSISDLKVLFDKYGSVPEKTPTESIKYLFGNFLTSDKSQHSLHYQWRKALSLKK